MMIAAKHGYSKRGYSARILALLGLAAGCSQSPAPAPRECPPFEPTPIYPQSLEAAREAHRRAELRRHLRFEEALSPGATLRLTARLAANTDIRAGRACMAELYEAGRILFEHEYSFADGLGSGNARERTSSPFRRVQRGPFGGPETISCTSCHWRGGPGGAGSLQDNSLLGGDGDRPESADARNPPLLAGAGVVQALAQEMSAELAAIRQSLLARVRRDGKPAEAPLRTKGISFGVLRVSADGTVDTSLVEGVDSDLVIRPFGWKGNFATLREFVAESLQVHMGIQSQELVDQPRERRDHSLLALPGSSDNPADPDGDGITSELAHGQLTALVVYVASLGLPVTGPPQPVPPLPPIAAGLRPLVPVDFTASWTRGQELFERIGCAACHTPMLVLNSPRFVTRGSDGSEFVVDLATQTEHPRLRYDPALGGYPVWVYSDFKRHDLGLENASRYRHRGVPEQLYMTRRLWGLGSSPPYFYDGRAPWLDDAIVAHGGEAELARDEYAALSAADKGALRLFLLSLHREPRVFVP